MNDQYGDMLTPIKLLAPWLFPQELRNNPAVGWPQQNPIYGQELWSRFVPGSQPQAPIQGASIPTPAAPPAPPAGSTSQSQPPGSSPLLTAPPASLAAPVPAIAAAAPASDAALNDRDQKVRRLALAMMSRGPTPAQQPGSGQHPLGSLAQGFAQGNQINQQRQMNDLMGIESPWQQFVKMFRQEPGPTILPGSPSYGGPR